MESNNCAKLLILDFGHPITKTSIQNIKLSFINNINLATTFSTNLNLKHYFGISIMNSNFLLVASTSLIKKDYNFIFNKINDLDKIIKNFDKITVQKYKLDLKITVNNLLEEFQKKVIEKKTDIGVVKIYYTELTLITKKSASVLAKLLKDTLNNLPEKYAKFIFIKKLKIIQIVNAENEEVEFRVYKVSSFIEWAKCLENAVDLDLLFKTWLLDFDTEGPYIEMVLLEETNLVLKCNLKTSVVNIYNSPLDFLGSSRSVRNLKIIHRLLASDISPALFFGISQIGYPICDFTNNWEESQVNLLVFKELCLELNRTKQGILAKENFKISQNEITFYYFIISDGSFLLFKNLVPNELFLQQCIEPPQPELEIHPNASLLVKTFLKKIEFLDEYSPAKFSSGLFEYFKNRLKIPVNMPNMLKHVDPLLLSNNKNYSDSKSRKRNKFDHKEITDTSYKESSSSSQPTKRQKQKLDFEIENIHPALLPPEVVNRYRKIKPICLPELKDDFDI